MQKHDYVLTFCINMFAPLLISRNNQVAYSNEITHIYICIKLHVYMCMKLERHKDSKKQIERTQRFQKTLKKLKRFVSLLISWNPYKDILKHYNL
jgi:hypothetical protein